jgi:hypothetical protein
MNTGLQILSDLTIFSKYAKYLPEQNRREDWNDCFSLWIDDDKIYLN